MTTGKPVIDVPSPAADRIAAWYHRLGILTKHDHFGRPLGWTRKRFYDLCKKINATPTEVAAICAAREKDFNRWLKQGAFPPYVSLNFALLEAAWIYAKTGILPTVIPLHEIFTDDRLRHT